MFFIFAPSSKDKAKTETNLGFNVEIPLPKEKEDGIIEDKREEYEQEHIRQRQNERMRFLHDFSSLFVDDVNENQSDETLLSDDATQTTQSVSNIPQSRTQPTQSRTQSSIHT